MSGPFPEEIHFRDLAKRWVDAVARHFARRGGDSFHECWVGDDLAIYVRYVQNGRKVATRFDDLLTDYLSGFPISLAGDDGAATSSMQANNLHDGGIAGAPPEEEESPALRRKSARTLMASAIAGGVIGRRRAGSAPSNPQNG